MEGVSQTVLELEDEELVTKEKFREEVRKLELKLSTLLRRLASGKDKEFEVQELKVFIRDTLEKYEDEEEYFGEKLKEVKRDIYEYVFREVLGMVYGGDRVLEQEIDVFFNEFRHHVYGEDLGHHEFYEVRASEDHGSVSARRSSIDLYVKREVLFPKEESTWEKIYDYSRRYIRILDWLPNYKKSALLGDIVAGITIGVMLIPQSIAYALVADLPPSMGLYTCFVPVLLYSFFGTSGQLSLGPTAMVSLLVAEGLQTVDVSATTSIDKLHVAMMIAICDGFFMMLMGILKMGFIANFLSLPVLSGFTSAAALVIMSSQFKYIFGIEFGRQSYFWQTVVEVIKSLTNTNGWTVLFFCLTSAFLLGMKYLPRFVKYATVKAVIKYIPMSFVVVVITTLISYGLNLEANASMDVIGNVSGGFPTPAWPSSAWDKIGGIALIAITISLVGFMESISAAKAMAVRNNYEIDANQELIALGVSNLVGGIFGAFPAGGALSRAAVNSDAGARTPLASIVSFLFITIALVVFDEKQILYDLPKNVLAAIIVVAAVSLIELRTLVYCWKTLRRDAFLWLLTFFMTLLLGIEVGIVSAIAMSIVLLVQQSSRPQYSTLGRLPGTILYRETERFPDSLVTPGVHVFRFEAGIFFGNVDLLKRRIRKAIQRSKTDIYCFILEASSINSIDTSGVIALKEIVSELRNKNIEFFITTMKPSVKEVLSKGGALDLIPESNFFLSVYDAVKKSRLRSHKKAIEKIRTGNVQTPQSSSPPTPDSLHGSPPASPPASPASPATPPIAISPAANLKIPEFRLDSQSKTYVADKDGITKRRKNTSDASSSSDSEEDAHNDSPPATPLTRLQIPEFRLNLSVEQLEKQTDSSDSDNDKEEKGGGRVERRAIHRRMSSEI